MGVGGKKQLEKWKPLLALPIAFVLFLGLAAQATAQSLQFRFAIGSSGTAPGEFSFPSGLAVDSTGRILVADTFNDRVQVFDATGAFLFSFGSSGTGPGQFSFPSDVAADSTGRILVADTFNDRVQVFDAGGGFLFSFGSQGTGAGQFNFPQDLTVDSTGRILVADTLNNRIQVFDATGAFLFNFGSPPPGSPGTMPGELNSPGGVAADRTGRILVSDTLNNRIQVFSGTGTFLFGFGSEGTQPGQFEFPAGLDTDSAGRIFVPDQLNNRVQVFDAGGAVLFVSGCLGTGPGQINAPTDVAVAGTGRVVVTDTFNNRVQVFVFAQSQVIVQTLSVSPTSVRVGDSITVQMTVKNVGIGAANNVTPTVTPSGTAVTLTSGPVPASATLAAGATATFAFTFRTDAPGTVTFTGGVTGIDAATGASLIDCPSTVTSVPVTVVAGAAPLTTTATVSPVPNANGWNNTNVTVTLAATAPGGSGVKEILFSLNGGPRVSVGGNVASVLISAEGTNTLTYFAQDSAGNVEVSKTLTVKIDKTPPTMTCSASPNILWPPNHRLVPVTLSVTVSDALSGPAGFVLTSATSNEPDQGLGQGHRPNDIQGFILGQPSTSLLLRAERSGRGNGRVYTLTYTGRDVAGNSAVCSATVTVPHDRKDKK